MAPGNAAASLMHQLQAFLVEIVRQVHAGLPTHVEVLTAGRTVLRASSAAGPFGVRVRMGKHDDDLWPHVEAVLELPGAPEEELLEVHPDTDVAGHAEAVLQRLRETVLS